MSEYGIDVALDKPLPQNPEAERSVLGSIVINNNAFYRVIGMIDTADFFRDANRTIFATMRRLAEESREIDLLTLKDALAKMGELEKVGGAAYIASLIDGIPDIANVEEYARIVREKSTLRRLVVMGNSVMRAALEVPSEPAEVLADAERAVFSIAEASAARGFASLRALTQSGMVALEQLSKSGGRLVTGIPTGYDRFNEFTSGFQRQDLIIIAARVSVGKTSYALNIAEAIAIPRRNEPQELYHVGIFSLEMSKEQLQLRILSSCSGVPSHLIRAGMLSERNWRDLAEASSRMAKATLWIDDTPQLDPLELRARARRLKMEAGLDLVIVDYLQLMTIKGKVENRNLEIGQISRGLKAIAKELNVPILALSQLSRRPEQRADHRPQLSDLRESGNLEADADIVVFIYRDELYNKETEDKGIAEIMISKNRNGPIGDFKLVFRNDLTKFYAFEPVPDYIPSDTARMTWESRRDFE